MSLQKNTTSLWNVAGTSLDVINSMYRKDDLV